MQSVMNTAREKNNPDRFYPCKLPRETSDSVWNSNPYWSSQVTDKNGDKYSLVLKEKPRAITTVMA